MASPCRGGSPRPPWSSRARTRRFLVEGLPRADRVIEGTHRLLERCRGVEAMGVEDVDVLEAHPAQALVEGGDEVLAGSPFSIGPVPHPVPGLCGDDQLVPIGAQVLCEHRAEIAFGGTGWRPVVVGQVEMGDPVVERLEQHLPCLVRDRVTTEVVPQPEGDPGQQQPAPSGTDVGHGVVTTCVGLVCHLMPADFGRLAPTLTRDRRAGDHLPLIAAPGLIVVQTDAGRPGLPPRGEHFSFNQGSKVPADFGRLAPRPKPDCRAGDHLPLIAAPALVVVQTDAGRPALPRRGKLSPSIKALLDRFVDAVDRWDRQILEGLGGRERDVGGGDPDHRPVEVPEDLFGDDRRDLGSPTAQSRVLLDRETAPGLGHRTEKGPGVERDQSPEVDDLGRDARRPRAARRLPARGAPSGPAPRSCSRSPPERSGPLPASRRARRRAPGPWWPSTTCARRRRPGRGPGSRRPSTRRRLRGSRVRPP